MQNKTKRTSARAILAAALIMAFTLLLAPAAAQENRTYDEEFPDPSFRAVVLQLLNEQDGGYRTDDDFLSDYDEAMLASVESLNVYNIGIRGIHDITGLRYFTGLRFLDASGNWLSELDVSNNPALVELRAYSNQLSELNVSNNPALGILVVFNNQLSKLDVSNNPALYSLNASDNRLRELDVSNNPRLYLLYASGNWLSELDVSNNPALRYLDVYYNQLSELDVSNNPALERLEVSLNYMQSTDDVIGWISNPGLVLGSTFLFNPQRTNPVTVTLTGIAVTNPPAKTAYTVGETLSISGLAITATYSNNSSKAVTGYATAPANGAVLSTVGTQTVTVTYVEGGVTKTTSFTVTVNAAEPVALPNLQITGYTLVGSTRFGLTANDFVYTAHVINTGGAAKNVTASLTGYQAGVVTVIDGVINLGNISENGTAEGNFTIRIPITKTAAFNVETLLFDFQYDQ